MPAGAHALHSGFHRSVRLITGMDTDTRYGSSGSFREPQDVLLLDEVPA